MDTVHATRRDTGQGVELLIERDCTISHNGRQFEAGGAMIAPDFAVAYMGKDMASVTDWHANPLGAARVVSSWKMPRSWQGDRQYQVEARINGRLYTGRTMGGGMIWRGKAKKESK